MRARPGLLDELADDELVASLLLVHGLHPESAGPSGRGGPGPGPAPARGHAGDVELLGIDAEAGAVRIRLLGSCDGCPSSSVTLQLAVERAIVEAAPGDRRASMSTSRRRPAERPGALRRQAGVRGCPAEMAAVDDRRMSDPLAVLRRIRQPRPRRRYRGRASGASCAPSRSPTSTAISSTCRPAT